MDFSPISEYIANQLYKKISYKESTILIANKYISNILEHLNEKESGFIIDDYFHYYRIAEALLTDYQTPVVYISLLPQEKKVLRLFRKILESCGICFSAFPIIEVNNYFYLRCPYPFTFKITNIDVIYNRIIKYITNEKYRLSIEKESIEFSESIRIPAQQEVDKKNKMIEEEYNLNDSTPIDELCWIKANRLYDIYVLMSELPSSEISDDILLFKEYVDKYDRKDIVKFFHDELYIIKFFNPEKLGLKTSPKYEILKWKLFTKVIENEINNTLDRDFLDRVSNQ